VTIVPFPAAPADTPASGESVTAAVERYLDSIKTRTTRSSYAGTLGRLVSHAGGRDTASLLPEVYAAVMAKWDDAAAATWSAASPPAAAIGPSPARLDKLFTDDRYGLRERVLWRMLYETAARAEELLSLNVEDLDLEFRRGRVTSKGGAIEYVHWATGTARLLPRLLRGRTSGPVFLVGRRAPVSGSRALPRWTSARRSDAAGCPTRAPSTCSSRPPPPTTRTVRDGRSTSFSSAGTSSSANGPPPRSPPTQTPQHDAGPADQPE
jgi:integrase